MYLRINHPTTLNPKKSCVLLMDLLFIQIYSQLNCPILDRFRIDIWHNSAALVAQQQASESTCQKALRGVKPLWDWLFPGANESMFGNHLLCLHSRGFWKQKRSIGAGTVFKGPVGHGTPITELKY